VSWNTGLQPLPTSLSISQRSQEVSQPVLSVYQYVGLTGDLYISQSVNLSASYPVMPAVSQLDYVSEYGFPTWQIACQWIYQRSSQPVSESWQSVSTWDEQGFPTLASQSVYQPAIQSYRQ